MATDKPNQVKNEYQHSETLYDAAAPVHNTPQQPGIINPLTQISVEQMSLDVDQFVEEHGLAEHRDTFWKGALNARDPEAPETLAAMTPEEQEAMQYERDHRWAGSKGLYFGIFICALGAATQGWDQTGSNGANLSFPQEFGLNRPSDTPEGQRDEWIIGLINSGPYLAAGLIGTWLSDPLNHYLGRRGEVLLTSIFLIATPIGSGFAQNWYQLFIIRLLMGAAFGAKNATVPVFSAELAPARVRGALVMGWQVWVCFGIMIGFAANLVVKDVPNIAWRLQLGSAFIPAVPLALGIYFCPESPKWLIKHGNYPKAYRSYLRLRMHPIQAARDMYYTHVLYEEERHMAAGSSYWSRLADCFRVPRIYRANMAATTVMFGQQTCGINIISFYSSTIFADSGFSTDQALYASLGYGALQFVAVCCVVPFMDKAGRRALLLVSFPGMALMLFGAAFSFLAPKDTDVRLGLIVLFIYLFTIFYSVGEGPIAFMHAAEVFPTIQREQGMAFAVFMNNTFAGILGLTFPRLLKAFGQTGAFCFYAALNLATLIAVFCFIRETKRLSLEEIDQVFEPRTSTFISYQTKQWLPYFVKRYILRQKGLRLEPFYVQHQDDLKRVATNASDRLRSRTGTTA